MHIYHIKVRGKNNFGKVKDVIKKIDAARARGFDITANQYPYTAMQHPWSRLFPTWVQNMPRKDAIAKLKDRAFRDKVKADPRVCRVCQRARRLGRHCRNRFRQVCRINNSKARRFWRCPKLRNQSDPAETCFDLIVEEGVFINGVHHTMSEEDVKFVMQVPWVSIASDGSAVNLKEPGNRTRAATAPMSACSANMFVRKKF